MKPGTTRTTGPGWARHHWLMCWVLSAPGMLLAATPAEPAAPPPAAPPPAQVAPAPSAPADAASDGDSGSGPMAVADAALNTTRNTMRSSAEWLARGVDGWFGDIPFSQGGKVTDGELGWSRYKRHDQPSTSGWRFKARFRLPNLESYQYVFVGNDDRQDIVTDRPDTFSRQQQLLRGDNRDSAFFAGIGTAVLNAIDLRLGFRGGLKPYAQARVRRPWQLGPADLVEFRETVFYSAADRLGSTTALSYEHAFSPTLAGRWVHALTATQASQDTNWSNSIGVYQSFGAQRLLSLEALSGGVIGSPVTIPDYGLQAKWSQPLRSDHLIGEIAVGHFWPRPDAASPRGKAWAVGTGLRLLF